MNIFSPHFSHWDGLKLSSTMLFSPIFYFKPQGLQQPQHYHCLAVDLNKTFINNLSPDLFSFIDDLHACPKCRLTTHKHVCLSVSPLIFLLINPRTRYKMSYHNTFKYDRNEPHCFSLCLVMLMWSTSLDHFYVYSSLILRVVLLRHGSLFNNSNKNPVRYRQTKHPIQRQHRT